MRKSGRRVLIGKIAMEDVSRAFEKGETEGFMKILVDADTKEILGASFLGPSGDEAIHCVLDAMYAKAPTRCSSAPCTSTPRSRNSSPGCCRTLHRCRPSWGTTSADNA